MAQYGFYIDSNNCIGCHTCAIACKDVNRLGVGENFRTVGTFCTGEFPDVHMYHISLACNHCSDPSCVSACKTGAMYKDPETGMVIHDAELCEGCKACIEACPYGAPSFIESKGVVGKCDGCAGLTMQGEQPSCVASCPMRAIEFGDIEELKARHPEACSHEGMPAFPDGIGIGPNLLVGSKQCMFDADFEAVVI